MSDGLSIKSLLQLLLAFAYRAWLKLLEILRLRRKEK